MLVIVDCGVKWLVQFGVVVFASPSLLVVFVPFRFRCSMYVSTAVVVVFGLW